MSDLFSSMLGVLGPNARKAIRSGRAAAKALSEQAANARQIAQAGLAIAEGADQMAKGLGAIADKVDAVVGTTSRKEDPRVRVRPAAAASRAAAETPKARARAATTEIVDAEVVREHPRKR